MNIEIVWDIINVLREYLKLELDESEEETKGGNPRKKLSSLSNVLAGLLCSFQIIDVGAGTAFAVEEKDFIDALYQVILRIFEHPFNYTMSDYLAFLKCTSIVFL